jgi:hypothetical protein
MRFLARLRLLAPLVGAFVVFPTAAEAQSRADLLRQATTALDDFDPARAIRLARAALNPQLGPLDTTWARGVHLLTQVLTEEQQPAVAKIWAQWAMRLQPTMAIDSVNFLSTTATTLREARAAAVQTAGDAGTRTTYAWPTATATTNEARFRVAPGGSPMTVLVRGVGLIGAQGLVVPPGTYEIEVSANGFLPLRVTREALPGVTAEFAFTLTSAAVAGTTLAADVRTRLSRATVPLQITRFGGQTACSAGVAAGGSTLVLTSYTAIRGADSVKANGAVKVAAWDVASNLAVLVLPAAQADTLGTAMTPIEGQSLWGVTLTECRFSDAPRVTLSTWEGRPLGNLALSGAPQGAATGSPLVDYQGNVTGVWTSGGRAAPMSVVAPLIAKAKENIAANRTQTPQQVATAENHRFGSVVIAVDVPGATVRVTPAEAWHWEELRSEGPAPLTFRGAAGRYTVNVSAPNVSPVQQTVVIRAGETVRAAISLRSVAQAPGGPAPAARRRGVPKWVWAVAIGGAVGGALALGGGGGGASGASVDFEVGNP